MARQAEEVIVLTESGKFTRHGVVPLRLAGQISRVVTDAALDPASRKALEASGIVVTTAE